jgi:hypothetical protein
MVGLTMEAIHNQRSLGLHLQEIVNTLDNFFRIDRFEENNAGDLLYQCLHIRTKLIVRPEDHNRHRGVARLDNGQLLQHVGGKLMQVNNEERRRSRRNLLLKFCQVGFTIHFEMILEEHRKTLRKVPIRTEHEDPIFLGWLCQASGLRFGLSNTSKLSVIDAIDHSIE